MLLRGMSKRGGAIQIRVFVLLTVAADERRALTCSQRVRLGREG
jgi:hypothetical protein